MTSAVLYNFAVVLQKDMPKRQILCPLCLVPYSALRQHCLKFHKLANKNELRLILNYASAIHSGRLDCPVCKGRNFARLDKHLENVHHEIKRDQYNGIVRQAKQKAKLKALRRLRTSNPQPAMVSTLDLNHSSLSSSEEEDEEKGRSGEEDSSSQQNGETGEDDPGPSTSVASCQSHSPVTKCRECSTLRLKVRHLKKKLLAYSNANTAPPSPPISEMPPPRKKYERAPTALATSKLPRFERLLNTWFQRITGPGKRQAENARQRVTHVRQWAIFMADSKVPDLVMSFLSNRKRFLEWVSSLKRHVVTTQLIIIGNVRGFLKFLLEAQLPEVKAPRKRLERALFMLQTLAKSPRKDLQTHRQAVRIRKSSLLVKPTHIIVFLRKAQKAIPETLSSLMQKPNKDKLDRFYGLLGGFIVCITGHRTGVVANMTTEEVSSAECDASQRRIIGVKLHKTRDTFGHAQVPLTKTEYMWLNKFIYRCHTGGDLLFSNSNGGPYKDIMEAFQRCWTDFGLPGTPTFSLIRSSIIICIGRSLKESKKVSVGRMMCHSIADKFCEVDLNFNEAFQTRKDIVFALLQNCKTNWTGEQTGQTELTFEMGTDGSESTEEEDLGHKDTGTEEDLERRGTERAGMREDSQAKRKKVLSEQPVQKRRMVKEREASKQKSHIIRKRIQSKKQVPKKRSKEESCNLSSNSEDQGWKEKRRRNESAGVRKERLVRRKLSLSKVLEEKRSSKEESCNSSHSEDQGWKDERRQGRARVRQDNKATRNTVLSKQKRRSKGESCKSSSTAEETSSSGCSEFMLMKTRRSSPKKRRQVVVSEEDSPLNAPVTVDKQFEDSSSDCSDSSIDESGSGITQKHTDRSDNEGVGTQGCGSPQEEGDRGQSSEEGSSASNCTGPTNAFLGMTK
uniref:uncharacterized protein LOC124052114 n=1 Tax=Scatophagus argus TaxID=75038 RepID=UPI001ED8498E|nr:uncharacterized protein LOC124052114 [Scatophagus argus]